jgi:hypothetical protein
LSIPSVEMTRPAKVAQLSSSEAKWILCEASVVDPAPECAFAGKVPFCRGFSGILMFARGGFL